MGKGLWAKVKEEASRSIMEDRLIGYLDPHIDPILAAINEIPLLATTSSCIGRITIVEGRRYWLRDNARIVYKTHDPISVDDIERVMRRPFTDLWLVASGPILHLKTPSFRCGLEVIATARNAGFKHSGLISASELYVVELMSSTQIYAPLRSRGKDLVERSSIGLLASLANETVAEGRQRLSRLVESLTSLEPCKA